MKVTIIVKMLAAGVMLMATGQTVAAGDAAKGEKVAKKCKACHTMDEGGKNGLGPNLYGILGRQAGGVEGFKYSGAMLDSEIIWDAATFNDFVLKPKSIVPGTKMSFKGVKKATQREDLLAYFQTLQSADATEPEAVGNVEEGIKVAEKHCVVCHTFEEGGKVVFGPNLFGIAGQPAAAIEGFRYSEALSSSGLTWTDVNLVGFLADPEGFVPGTTARFPGLKTAGEKADILAYMKSLQ
ncbi:MAG: c-type cytochrome [Paracoccaceae bacterium]